MIAEPPQFAAGGPQEIIRLLQNELEQTNREVLLLTMELDKRVQERTSELFAAQLELRDKNSELLKRTAQLEQANKELEAFSYSVSHDLRAPLRHINGFLHALEEDCTSGLSTDAKQYIKAIFESAARMNALIDDLLSFSRNGRAILAKTQVNMPELVSEVIGETADETKDREIRWDLQALPSIPADRSLLKQVWTNLISNALKYTRPRKTASIAIGAQEKGNQWEFFVRDNGVGFDMRFAERLFGVFQRLHTQQEFEGTGIGLANVRQIVRRHGGDTRAESEVDKGTTIYFSLPKDQDSPST